MKKYIFLLLLISTTAYAGTPPAAWPFVADGLKGDSTDETTSLQTWLNNAAGKSGILVLDSGVYLLTDSIYVPEGVLLRGNNSRLRFELSGNKKALIAYSSTTIEGLTISVKSSTGGMTGELDIGAAIAVGKRGTGVGYHNVTLRDLTLSTQRYSGAALIITGESYNVVAENVHVTTNDSLRYGVLTKWGGTGANPTYHPHNIQLRNISVDSLNAPDSNGYGVSFHGAYNSVLDGYDFKHGYLGVDVRPDDSGFIKAANLDSIGFMAGITIRNAHIHSFDDFGMRLAGVVDGTTNDTISMRITVENSTIVGPDTSSTGSKRGTARTGIWMRYINSLVVRNTSIGNVNASFSWGPSVSNVSFLDCYFTDAVFPASVNSGNYPDWITFERCLVDNNYGDYGFHVDKAKNVTFRGCIVDAGRRGLTKYGFFIDNTAPDSLKVRLYGNHVAKVLSNANAQAYRVDGGGEVWAWDNNTIEVNSSSNLTTAKYSTNALFDYGHRRQAVFGFPIPDSTDVLADNQVLTFDASDSTWNYETPPGAGGGESNTASDAGTGFQLTLPKSGVDLPVKTLTGGTGITLDSTTANEVGISVTASTYLPLAGGTMAGDLSMGSNAITSLDGVTYVSGMSMFSTANRGAGMYQVDYASDSIEFGWWNGSAFTAYWVFGPFQTLYGRNSAILSGDMTWQGNSISATKITQNAGTDISADLEEESHASEHQDGGADEIAVTAGMMNTGTGASASTYWRGDNTWATPAGGGGGSTDSLFVNDTIAKSPEGWKQTGDTLHFDTTQSLALQDTSAFAITITDTLSTYETVAEVAKIGDDTANYQAAYGWGDWSTTVGKITDDTTNYQTAYTHITSDGSDHSFIDQDVTIGSSPTLDAANITGIQQSDTSFFISPSTESGGTRFVTWIGDTLRIDAGDDTATLQIEGGRADINILLTQNGVTVGSITLDSNTGDMTLYRPGKLGTSTYLRLDDSGRVAASIFKPDNDIETSAIYSSDGVASGGQKITLQDTVQLPYGAYMGGTFNADSLLATAGRISDSLDLALRASDANVDTAGWNRAVDSVDAYDNGGINAGHIATGGVATAEILDGTIGKADIDSTSSNFAFDDAYHVTTATADSLYITAKTVNDTGDVLRGEMADSAQNASIRNGVAIGKFEVVGPLERWGWKYRKGIGYGVGTFKDVRVSEADQSPAPLNWEVLESGWDSPEPGQDSLWRYTAGHPDHLYIPGGFNGVYPDIYTFTPLSDSSEEDPFIIVSADDGATFEKLKVSNYWKSDIVYGDTMGCPGGCDSTHIDSLTNPVFSKSDFAASFLSDVNLSYTSDRKLLLTFRASYADSDKVVNAWSDSGLVWDTATILVRAKTGTPGAKDSSGIQSAMSPSWTVVGDSNYVMYTVEGWLRAPAGPQWENQMMRYEYKTYNGATFVREDTTDLVPPSGFDIWHIKIRNLSELHVVALVYLGQDDLAGTGNGGLIWAHSFDGGFTWDMDSQRMWSNGVSTANWSAAHYYRATWVWEQDGAGLNALMTYGAQADSSGTTFWRVGQTRVYFRENHDLDSSDFGNGALSEDNIQWRQYHLPMDIIYGRADIPTDSVYLSLPHYQDGIVLFQDSTGESADADSIWLSGSIPFEPLQLDTIFFAYRGDGEIDSLYLYGPDRSDGTNVADSLYATIDVSLTGATWAVYYWVVNITPGEPSPVNPVRIGDNFALKMVTNLLVADDQVEVAWCKMVVTR